MKKQEFLDFISAEQRRGAVRFSLGFNSKGEGKILNNVKKWQIPRFINTDKAPAYGRALALLKREGRCPSDVEHRQIKYRNNVIECDHGKLKRIIGATLGFKSMKTAYATIKGIEVMRALRKGQASAFYYGDPLGEMRLVSRVFEM